MSIILILFLIFAPTVAFAIVTYFILFSESYRFIVIYNGMTNRSRTEYFTIKATNPQNARRKVRELAEEECMSSEYIDRIIPYNF